MTELVLTRSRDERRLYVLEGVGTLRLEGLASRSAAAEADGRHWRFGRRGFWGRRIEATDVAGTTVGEFTMLGMRRGGTLDWDGRGLELRARRRAGATANALVDGARELALLDGKSWGRHPVKVTVADLDLVEPGLLLFAVFVVRGLAEDTSTAAAGGAAAAAAAGSS
jgi:hypothetical protein